MVHKERPYQSADRRAYNFYPKLDPSRSSGLQVNPEDEEKRAVRVVDSYLLHHIRSDQVTPPQDRDLLFS